jgi:DNA invertase Pin-like site-specific DNA recombinase
MKELFEPQESLNLEECLSNHIVYVLNQSKTINEAIYKLKSSNSTVYRWIRKYGIKKKEVYFLGMSKTQYVKTQE